jgi:hypothetical protein
MARRHAFAAVNGARDADRSVRAGFDSKGLEVAPVEYRILAEGVEIEAAS